MRITLASDEPYAVDHDVLRWLREHGHDVHTFGAFDGQAHPWVPIAVAAAAQVGNEADEAVLLCWSGTGVTMAANKVPGVRAALCGDAATAIAARTWNHANVLCLAHRTLTADLVREILPAWFAAYDAALGRSGVDALKALDRR